MNAKKCKAARRLARQTSVGMPERKLLGKARKVKRQHKGKLVEYETQQAVNDPRSTRGVYRAIKRALRQGFMLDDLRAAPSAQEAGAAT